MLIALAAQYYTLKLLFLAYLIHPQTQGAMKMHNMVFRRLFYRNATASAFTPPTAHPSLSSKSSPTGPSASSAPVTAGINETQLPAA